MKTKLLPLALSLTLSLLIFSNYYELFINQSVTNKNNM